MPLADADVRAQRDQLSPFYAECERVLIGQRTLLDRILIGLLTQGHLLLEGVPGLAKTLTVRTVAQALHLQFKRIQFTPDLLPADVIGTQVYHPRDGEFSVKRGPIFAQIVLADEINRAPAKVQSALLEAMEERQVTIGDSSLSLPAPFLVLATQNPIEQEGTYPLPEAQLDRFLMKVVLNYPSVDEECQILDRMGGVGNRPQAEPVLSREKLAELQQIIDQIYVDPLIKRYIVDVVQATRDPKAYGIDIAGMIQHGASPRATLSLYRATRAYAFLDGRGYVTPHDVKTLAKEVMRHRVVISYEAEAEELRADDLIQRILDQLPVP